MFIVCYRIRFNSGRFGSIQAGLPFDREEEFAENSFLYPFAGVTMLGGTVAGAPFYLLEKVFYDFPRYVIESDEQTVR